MRCIIIESPYAGDLTRNKLYLQRAIRDALKRGEAPFASHQMYTDALDDTKEDDRRLGIEAGFAWLSADIDLVAFYEDYGSSPGMCQSFLRVVRLGLPWEFRKIGENP